MNGLQIGDEQKNNNEKEQEKNKPFKFHPSTIIHARKINAKAIIRKIQSHKIHSQ
jgi:hypothetical protein